ncbi:MAG TPA: hypothetical protein DCM28_00810 [Phycisphaerales bacterium]|nr:hypothetical protein [Phycisphaerales bacterium]
MASRTILDSENEKAATQGKLKHDMLVDTLKTQIRSGRYKVGDKLPSEHELARDLDVSRHTILRGLSTLAAEGWIDRQQGRGTFVAKRSNPTHIGNQVIAFICSDKGDSVISRVIRGISQALRSRRQEMLLLDSDHSIERERELLESLVDRGVGGAILWPVTSGENRQAVEQLQSQDFPLVIIDHGMEGSTVPLVCVDHELGAYEVTRHLVRCGYKRIAHITFAGLPGELSEAVLEREAGYRRALDEAGLPFDDELIQRVDRNLMRLSHEPMVREMLAYEQAHRLMASDNRPDAIFLLNDIFAPSVYRAALNQGMQIRKDVAIAGFNNDPEACMLPVPMTTYDLPAEQVGFQSIELLNKLVANQPITDQTTRIAGQLMVRNSTVENIAAYCQGI